ncbi:MAG: replication endonuclease [Curvibacter lanceolatus]|uniref:replication endonuclease n=1 Tax=Curvibacter lanceolatus TaxID=86182 RepID=UPI0023571027|nr:replication endonuclease [Curvibacter lanceolatus]MBV5292425.1 replication endonuclease [Curvibacter lanceolatus]
MNYNDKKENIKSLKSYIINKFNHNINELNDSLENEQLYNQLVETKLSYIPVDLKDEVCFYVKEQFNNNFEEYFKTVEIYFETFELENLSKCNIKDSAIYEQSNTKGRRFLNRERKHNLWHASVLLKLVGKNRGKYSSNSIFNEFKMSKKKEFEFIENCKIVNKDKKVFNLKDCVKTVKQSIAEKLNLINVQEKIAESKNWTWCFITLTLEGEYHPNPSFESKTKYNGISPKESAKYLNEKNKKVRSLLAYRGIKAGRDYIGCSSAEAHKDGCLHKHLLFFCSAEMLEKIREAFSFHFPNLNDESFKINNGQAKASSYIFKYVMKSITSYDSNIDFEYIDKEQKNAVLNNAFRSYNFIRGFSFFGIENCLTKFRFIARNLKAMNLPIQIEELVKENNLYELLTQNYFDMFENQYIENAFIGCKYLGNLFMKNFFSLVRKALNIKEETISIHSKFAEIKENEVKLILSHNYSRENRLTAFEEENNYFNWLFDRRLINNQSF